LQNLFADIDNAWLKDIRLRGVQPYGWKIPASIPETARISANFEIEIPGDLVQRATSARMLDPQFALSYSYVVDKLFPEIKNPLQERARRLADQAELSPQNSIIAQIRYYRKQAAFLSKTDADAARLYELAADAAEAQLGPAIPKETARKEIGTRTEGQPQYNIPETVAS
jgi:hypothetical protein